MLREQWNALVMEADRPEVFYTYEWALAVHRAYAGVLVPWLLLQYEGDALVGVAALAIESGRPKATFLSGATADYCDFLSPPERRIALVNCVLGELRKAGVQELVLPNVLSTSATVEAVGKVAGDYGYHVFWRTAYICPQVNLGSAEDREQLKTRLNKRKIFRRGMNFLGRRGKVSLVHRTTPEAVEEVLPEFALAHVARFLATGRLSNLVSQRRRDFVGELARLLSKSGWLALSQMLVGDQPIGWNFGFRFRGSWFWYQPTFETSYEQISPGYCLLSNIIAEACNTPEIRSVDLGLGEEEYKERFASDSRVTLHATITTSRGRQMAEMARYGTARVAKVSPRLENGLRSGIRRMSAARSRVQESGWPGFAAWGVRRFAGMLSSHDEVVFYEWEPSSSAKTVVGASLRLEPMSLQHLAAAAMQFEGDRPTEEYLLRSASRLQSGGATGFVLLHEANVAVHFCWAAPFDGFKMAELATRLSAPSANATLIFDCWTSSSMRGRGYYGACVTLAAMRLLQEGRAPWIFSASSNHGSIRGLAKTGFQRRYSMVRNKTLMVQRVKKVIPIAQAAAEVAAGL